MITTQAEGRVGARLPIDAVSSLTSSRDGMGGCLAVKLRMKGGLQSSSSSSRSWSRSRRGGKRAGHSTPQHEQTF